MVTRWRRWLQFSVRSVLLLTAAVAILSAWLIAPEARNRTLGRANVRIREAFVRQIDPKTKQPTAVPHGRWELFDEHGVLRIRGQYENGKPAGKWTFYDVEGNPLLPPRVP